MDDHPCESLLGSICTVPVRETRIFPCDGTALVAQVGVAKGSLTRDILSADILHSHESFHECGIEANKVVSN